MGKVLIITLGFLLLVGISIAFVLAAGKDNDHRPLNSEEEPEKVRE